MILTDHEIKLAIENGLVRIDPVPEPSAFGSVGVDLTLDSDIVDFVAPSSAAELVLDPGHPEFNSQAALARMSVKLTIGEEGYVLRPHQLVLACTRESISLAPRDRIVARIEGKSSLARLGLGLHMTSPMIQPGFSGRIALEVTNYGKVPVRLRAGMRICQLTIERWDLEEYITRTRTARTASREVARRQLEDEGIINSQGALTGPYRGKKPS